MRPPFERSTKAYKPGRLGWSLVAACLLGITGLIGTTPTHAQEAVTPQAVTPQAVTPEAVTPQAVTPEVVIPQAVTQQAVGPEAVRYALSRQLLTAPQPFTQPTFISLGPFRGQLGAGVGIGFDDNANLTKTDTHSELVFDQSLDLNLNWVISHLNELGFRLGATLTEVVGGAPGEQKFRLAIDPGSNIEFKIFVGDFLIRLHNYLTVIQDPTQNPAVSGQSNLNQLTNNAGIAVDWDLSKLILTAGFDYSYYTDLGGGSGGASGIRNTIRPSLAASFALTPTMNTGLETAYSASFGAGSSHVDAFTVGPFLRGKLTRFITIDLSGGLYVIQPSSLGPTDYFLSLNIRHHLTRILSYGASFTRDLEFSGANSLTRNNAFTLDVQYLLRRNLTLAASGIINFGNVLISNPIVGVLPGSYVQYEAYIGLTWRLSRRIRTSLGYRFIDRNADQGSYKQNRVDLGLGFAF
jgi:hypothetical protein